MSIQEHVAFGTVPATAHVLKIWSKRM